MPSVKYSTIDNVAFVSYGNDSIALIQWAREHNLENLVCAHSDTGWAANWWKDRVAAGEKFAQTCGFATATIPSMGMRDLVRMKKGWPRHGMQFCTTILKLEPAQKWLDKHDPDKNADCLVGVRRSESARRATWPEWVEESENHGGRSLWSPLVKFTDEDRDQLIRRSGLSVLPHRSMECFPCINSNRNDLRQLTEERIEDIEQFEAELGINSKGNLRTMFRPYKHMGATGIREVIRWANSKHGKYQKPLVVLSDGAGCDGGMCTD